ncbi:hypothetical protein SCFA_1670005 [anaerobic digester metagenome]|uniref:Uncharacterized protein n=1 Tax=anaerobic digester metagenome TaxID=1263854 RepID=A0A485LY32_9ZZZZ
MNKPYTFCIKLCQYTHNEIIAFPLFDCPEKAVVERMEVLFRQICGVV